MPKYLIRFDDICPTMRWSAWDRVEALLIEHGVLPIVSVIPDNRDERLELEPACGDFWQRVRAWQARGWTLGMHGYQHRYTSMASGIVGIKNRSEFAGLGLAEQRAKLEAAFAVFRREGVVPRVWVAPGHSFDGGTLRLLPEIGITHVSDGLFLGPRRDRDGILWVPQQLWRFRRMPFGIWTVCLHANRWHDAEIAQFARDLAAYRSRIASFEDVVRMYSGRRPENVENLLPRMMLRFMRLKSTAWGARASRETR